MSKLKLSLQTADPEIVRDNFKKLMDAFGKVEGGSEIIYFSAQNTITVLWTPERAAAFGQFPSIEIWSLFNDVYYKNDVAGKMDAPPPDFTNIVFDFLTDTGDTGTGFITIT